MLLLFLFFPRPRHLKTKFYKLKRPRKSLTSRQGRRSREMGAEPECKYENACCCLCLYCLIHCIAAPMVTARNPLLGTTAPCYERPKTQRFIRDAYFPTTHAALGALRPPTKCLKNQDLFFARSDLHSAFPPSANPTQRREQGWSCRRSPEHRVLDGFRKNVSVARDICYQRSFRVSSIC